MCLCSLLCFVYFYVFILVEINVCKNVHGVETFVKNTLSKKQEFLVEDQMCQPRLSKSVQPIKGNRRLIANAMPHRWWRRWRPFLRMLSSYFKGYFLIKVFMQGPLMNRRLEGKQSQMRPAIFYKFSTKPRLFQFFDLDFLKLFGRYLRVFQVL